MTASRCPVSGWQTTFIGACWRNPANDPPRRADPCYNISLALKHNPGPCRCSLEHKFLCPLCSLTQCVTCACPCSGPCDVITHNIIRHFLYVGDWRMSAKPTELIFVRYISVYIGINIDNEIYLFFNFLFDQWYFNIYYCSSYLGCIYIFYSGDMQLYISSRIYMYL